MTQQPETEADAPTRPFLIEPEISPNALTDMLARLPQFASPLRGMEASCQIEALPDCELTPEGEPRRCHWPWYRQGDADRATYELGQGPGVGGDMG